MTKSVRSKWKKRMAKAKTEAVRPMVLERCKALNDKLHLVARNAISTVPMQAPCPHFHFQHPSADPTAPLKLSGFTTNVRKGLRGHEGNADGSAGINSARRTKAQYHDLAAAAAAAQQQQQAGAAAAASASFEDAAPGSNVIVMRVAPTGRKKRLSGGGVGGDAAQRAARAADDDAAVDDDRADAAEGGAAAAAAAAPERHVTVLPKAADLKRSGARKLRDEPRVKLAAGGIRKAKQGAGAPTS
jgi:hypothetical protein